jgi:hypothetical protein
VVSSTWEGGRETGGEGDRGGGEREKNVIFMNKEKKPLSWIISYI